MRAVICVRFGSRVVKPSDQGKLYAATDPAVGRFGDKLDEDEQETFKSGLLQRLRPLRPRMPHGLHPDGPETA